MTHSVSHLISEHSDFEAMGGSFAIKKNSARITGPDAEDFLQRISTQNVKLLKTGHGSPTAFLEPDGKIVSYFDLYRFEKEFLLVADAAIFKAAVDHMEKLHFAEDLQVEDVSSEWSCLSVQGSRADEVVAEIVGAQPQENHAFVEKGGTIVAREPDFSAERAGYHVFRKNLAPLMKKIPECSENLWRIMRAEAGHFEFGVDVSSKNLILEVAMADSVSRGKGCYPGQEVVERIFTYGTVGKKLVGLEIEGHASGAVVPQTKLYDGAEDAGLLTSVHVIPWSGKVVGFAMVRKPHFELGRVLTFGTSSKSSPRSFGRIIEIPQAFVIKRELK